MFHDLVVICKVCNPSFAVCIGTNEDYFDGPYFILFPAGMTEAVFNIFLIDNGILEETETFSIIINSSSLPNTVTVGEPGGAEVKILDDDGECK